jgi:hypothetical protein
MRHLNWRSRLSSYIERRRMMPFEHYINDCASFTAGAIEAITEIDLMSGVEPYDSYEQGLLNLRRCGYMSPIDILRAHFPVLRPSSAAMGDVVVMKTVYGPVTGVVGSGRFFYVGQNGLMTSDIMPVAAFRVE